MDRDLAEDTDGEELLPQEERDGAGELLVLLLLRLRPEERARRVAAQPLDRRLAPESVGVHLEERLVVLDQHLHRPHPHPNHQITACKMQHRAHREGPCEWRVGAVERTACLMAEASRSTWNKSASVMPSACTCPHLHTAHTSAPWRREAC